MSVELNTLQVPALQGSRGRGDKSSRAQGKGSRPSKYLRPEDYAALVHRYSTLKNGAGQNHQWLGEFLTGDRSAHTALTIGPPAVHESFVHLYVLEVDQSNAGPSAGNGTGPASVPRQLKMNDFDRPWEYHNWRERTPVSQSQITFLRGWQTADWISNVGARYLVDPEYFCRHLDFRSPDDRSNNFSTPALPSSSWHLMQLPVMSIVAGDVAKGSVKQCQIDELRDDRQEALLEHHRDIQRSKLFQGDSMVRDIYTFDEAHFAIEQRISICLERDEQGGANFNLFVWLDSGTELDVSNKSKWAMGTTNNALLPVIRHQVKVALKFHRLFADPNSGDSTDETSAQSASMLHHNYGRFLHPSIMNGDAFYALNEVFAFVASSEMQFLNLVEVKLDKYTASADDAECLANIKYTRDILYSHIKKIQRSLDCIRNTDHRKWPKETENLSKAEKAETEAGVLRHDFEGLLNRANALHNRCDEATQLLIGNLNIAESTKGIEQSGKIAKLTFLAFFFAPLSFTTSFFGMNVRQLADGKPLQIYWWVVLSVVVWIFTLALYFIDWTWPFHKVRRKLFKRKSF